MKADERTRTVNLLITNQLLCQLSHIGVFCFYMLHRSIGRAQASLVCSPLIDKVNKPELSHIGVFCFYMLHRSIGRAQASLVCSPLIDKVNKPELSHIGVFSFYIAFCVPLENFIFPLAR